MTVPHDLPAAKHDVYGFDKEAVSLRYSSYLNFVKQSVHTKNKYSNFVELISGVPQDSVLGTLLFHIFPDDLFLFIKKASTHNYEDDNTLSAYSSNLNLLIDILFEESETTISWHKKMIW